MVWNRKVSVFTLLLTCGALLAIGVALAFHLYLTDRQARVSAMGSFCGAMGGSFFVELQDDNYVIRFSDRRFGNEALEKIMQRAAQLPGPPPFGVGYTGQIWLQLAHSGVDDAGMQFLTPQVTYLDLRGCAISSSGVGTIVEHAPRLHTLLLANTRINNDALKAIDRRLPRLWQLDVSHTSITAEGLRPLSGTHYDVSVEGTGISSDDLDRLKIGLHINN